MAKYEQFFGTFKKLRMDPEEGSDDIPVEDVLYRYVATYLDRVALSDELINLAAALMTNREQADFLESLKSDSEESVEPRSRHRRGLVNDNALILIDAVEAALESKSGRSPEEIRAELKRILSKGRGEMPSGERELPRRLMYLKDAFSLSREEAALLLFFFLYEVREDLESFYDAFDYKERAALLAMSAGTTVARVETYLSVNGKLIGSGLLESKRFDEFHKYTLNISSVAGGFLSGLLPMPLHRHFCRTDDAETLPLDSFSVSDESAALFVDFLRAGCSASLLLFGTAGTGKTEFARAAAAAAGKTAYFLTSGNDGGNKSRRLALVLAIRTVNPKTDVLVVDEADDFLNTEAFFLRPEDTTYKGWLNEFLDKNTVPIVWISNSISRIPESVLRRFYYSIKFEPCTAGRRERLFRTALGKRGMSAYFDEKTIRKISREYRVNAAGITGVVSAFADLRESADAKERAAADPGSAEKRLRDMLVRHEYLLTGRDHAGGASVTSRYDPAVLNIDTPVERIVSALKAFSDPNGKTGTEARNMSLLFWGESGTGKTEFAKYAAGELSRELVQRRASDLLSMWVGGTEKNIAAAFREAETDRAILLLDEADSLFIDRSKARHSWEGSQTNELLTRMENFAGILICCTNFLEGLDPASLRRFAFKVGFRPLTKEGKRILMGGYFPHAPLSPEFERRLELSSSLTPGDFKAVWQRTTSRECAEKIVEELIRESGYRQKERKIQGFGAA